MFEFRVPKPEQLDEAEAATQINPYLEHPNEIFKFRVPEPEQLDEAKAAIQINPNLEHQNEIAESRVYEPEKLDGGFEYRLAACRNPDQEQLSNDLDTRKVLWAVYQQYLRTRRRATVLERLVEDYSGIEFRPSTGLSRAQEELNILRPILDRQRTSILSLAEQWFSQLSEGP